MFKKQLTVPFWEKYSKARHPPTVTDGQIGDLSIRTGLPGVGKYELKLALSVIESETINHVNLPNKVREVLVHWRRENPADPDQSARAQLMGQLSAVVAVSEKIESARLAQQESEKAGAELTRAWRSFEELPKKFGKVVEYLATVNGVLAGLEHPPYDGQIQDLMRQIMRARIEGIDSDSCLRRLSASTSLALIPGSNSSKFQLLIGERFCRGTVFF